MNENQITLDGVGAAHDATRHLAGGGPTFERITGNLRSVKIQGRLVIRHNAHAGNMSEVEKLRTLIDEIAEESGNDLVYVPSPVQGSPGPKSGESRRIFSAGRTKERSSFCSMRVSFLRQWDIFAEQTVLVTLESMIRAG